MSAAAVRGLSEGGSSRAGVPPRLARAPSGLGFLPIGGGRVSFFWSLRGDRLDAWRRSGLAAWKDEVLSMSPRAAPVLAQVADPAQLVHATYTDGVLWPWHQPGLVFAGDAAHATSPQLGQGANLALCNAASLADRIAADLEAALCEHERARRAHVAFYQHASRWLTPLFQSSHAWLGPLRDLGVPLALRVPWFRRQSVQAMAGLKTGWLGALPPPAPTGAARPAAASAAIPR